MNKRWVMDLLGWATKRAELLCLLGLFNLARDEWKRLLVEYSAENYHTHR
jgi:hypothetical protein